MSQFAYLIGLLIGISGMLIIDRRFKLAFWSDARRTWMTLLPAVAVFILWDLAGIASGTFFHGKSNYSLPFTILPEFPIEELFFLFLLCYTALLFYLGAKRRWPRT